MHLIRILSALLALPSLPALYATAQAGETKGGPFAVLKCPASGASQQVYDLSTGMAPWVVRGPGIPNGEALATRISDATIPASWAARLPGARWVQAMPQTDAAPHAPGDYTFELTFTVPRGKRLPRLALQGQVAADEGLDLTLIEPSPPGSFIGGGTGGSRKRLGQRAVLYRLESRTPNGSGNQATLGLLAQLHLTTSCGARK
jgi:hypothetical protein